MTKPTGKTLKLTFAMGGGVSLGAFSGSALTEALKLLLVDGRDANGQRYARIELDSMSGASAGAVSLCIMLSSLLNYKRYIADDALPGSNRFPLDKIDGALTAQFGAEKMDEFKRSNLIEPLRALQVSQELQKVLWVQKLNMKGLMNLHEFDPKKKDNFSLLDRKLLLDLINDYILTDIEQINEGTSHIVTKDRFLFACSLTNLIPWQLGNRHNDETEALVRELKKAHTSYNHKELRLFDFRLNESANTSTSRLTKAIEVNQDTVVKPETWSMITATCLACAAFPFAFEPVVLKRYDYEYKINNAPPAEDAPPTRENFKEKIFTPEHAIYQSESRKDYNQKIDQSLPWQQEAEDKYYLFSYIDGGTLNNEPIREGFRMANYIDSRDPSDKESYDRLVVFVDPIVRSEEVKHNSPSFYKYIVGDTGKGAVVKDNTEGRRMQAFVGKIITTLRDQGSIKEEHKISTYMSSIKLNEKLTSLIAASPFEEPFSADFVETVQEFLLYQDQQNNDDHISTFDVNDARFLEILVHRFITDTPFADERDDILFQLVMLLKTVRERGKSQLDDIALELNQTISDRYRPVVKKIIYQNILQAVLDADGKDPSAIRMAITPVRYDTANDGSEIVSTVKLPGEEFQAFGGFASESARAFSNEYGRYCAYHALSRPDFRSYYERVMNMPASDHQRMIQPSASHNAHYSQSLEELSPLIGKEKPLTYFKEIQSSISGLMARRIAKSLKPILRTNVFLSLIALFILTIFLPWAIQPLIHINASIIQFLLVLCFGALIYYIIQRSKQRAMRAAFFMHQFPSIKLGVRCVDTTQQITHFTFNNEKPYRKALRRVNHHLIAIPYFLGFAQALDQNRTIHFLRHKKLAKSFNHIFSEPSLDLQPKDEIRSIQFYKKKSFLSTPKQLFSIPIETLYHKIENIDQVEKFISPIITCDAQADQLHDFKLEDEAVPLKNIIMRIYHQKNNQL